VPCLRGRTKAGGCVREGEKEQRKRAMECTSHKKAAGSLQIPATKRASLFEDERHHIHTVCLFTPANALTAFLAPKVE